jgi:hypothetical protein
MIAPSKPAKTDWLWAIAGLAVLAVLLLFPFEGQNTRFAGALEDAGHAPLFALVAWSALRWRRRGRAGTPLMSADILGALLIALVLAVSTEALQPLTGRDAAWNDLMNDASGAVAALCVSVALHARRARPQGILLWFAAILLASISTWPLVWSLMAYQHRAAVAPMLLDLNTSRGRYFLQRNAARIESLNANAWLISPTGGDWPGLGVIEVLPDWRDYKTLVIDLTNPGTTPLQLLVRIDDHGQSENYSDRFNGRFSVAPGQRFQWRMPLATLRTSSNQRAIELGRMRRIYLFQRGNGAMPFVLHALTLER